MNRFALTLLLLLTSSVAFADTVTQYQATLTNLGVVSIDGRGDNPISVGQTTFETPLPSGLIPAGTPLFSPADTGISGRATFTLTEPANGDDPFVTYRIVLSGVDLIRPTLSDESGIPADSVFDPQTPGLENDLDQIHIHNTRLGNGATREYNTPAPHALNIFGRPSTFEPVEFPFGGEDADLFATQSGANVILTGLWDAGDETFDGPPSTNTPEDSLAALRDGQLHLLIHTLSPEAIGGAGGAAIGGVLVQVPEPAAATLTGACLLGIATRRRRVSRR